MKKILLTTTIMASIIGSAKAEIIVSATPVIGSLTQTSFNNRDCLANYCTAFAGGFEASLGYIHSSGLGLALIGAVIQSADYGNYSDATVTRRIGTFGANVTYDLYKTEKWVITPFFGGGMAHYSIIIATLRPTTIDLLTNAEGSITESVIGGFINGGFDIGYKVTDNFSLTLRNSFSGIIIPNQAEYSTSIKGTSGTTSVNETKKSNGVEQKFFNYQFGIKAGYKF